MKNTIREKILKQNNWVDSNEKFGLIMTDDLDSLLGCSILKEVKGWDIEQIFLFKADKTKSFDLHGVLSGDLHEPVGVDFALTKGKCFDNHLTSFVPEKIANPEAVNLNNVCEISRKNYYKKYNTSTTLLLWSLYDLPKESLDDELMMLLLSIDGTQDAYYLYGGKFRMDCYKWLVSVLELDEFYKCFERHTYQDFIDIRKKYGFDPKHSDGNGKITLHKGQVETKIDIEGINELLMWYTDIQLILPTEIFKKKAVYKDKIMNISSGKVTELSDILNGDVHSYAITQKNTVNYSIKF